MTYHPSQSRTQKRYLARHGHGPCARTERFRVYLEYGEDCVWVCQLHRNSRGNVQPQVVTILFVEDGALRIPSGTPSHGDRFTPTIVYFPRWALQ